MLCSAVTYGCSALETTTVIADSNRFSPGVYCRHRCSILGRIFTFLPFVFHPLPNTHSCCVSFPSSSETGHVFTLISPSDGTMASPVVVRLSPVCFLAGDGLRKRPVYPTKALKSSDKMGVLEIIVQLYKTITFLHVYSQLLAPSHPKKRNADSATFSPHRHWTMDVSSVANVS